MKRALKLFFITVGVGAVILFVWRTWGETGRIDEFFLMIWDWFYALWSGVAEVLNQLVQIF